MPATILVVDEDPSYRDLSRGILEHAGLDLKVRECSDTAQARTLALGGEIDVVLCSMAPPRLDGLALLRSLRLERDSNALPIILVASGSDPTNRELSFDAGANDYLFKPFSATELVSRVQVQLRVKSLQEELRRASDRERRLGTHDELTGLANRRHLLEQARRELARSRRHGFAMSLCALDVDHFRKVNDRLGYLAGDAVIAEVGHIVVRCLRIPDVLARVGGARFLALLPQTDAKEALLVCDRMRSAVAAHPFVGLGQSAVAISVGCATYPRGRLESVDELVNAAEASLDRAKSSGGNRVEVFSEDARLPAPLRD